MSGRQFLYIIITTSITIMIWVVLDIVHSRSQTQIPAQIQQLLEPIDPTLDQELINRL